MTTPSAITWEMYRQEVIGTKVFVGPEFIEVGVIRDICREGPKVVFLVDGHGWVCDCIRAVDE